MGFVASVCQPSTLRMVICPEASSAQNNIAAVSADGSTVCVLMRRLNSSCSRSIAFVVRADFHWLSCIAPGFLDTRLLLSGGPHDGLVPGCSGVMRTAQAIL